MEFRGKLPLWSAQWPKAALIQKFRMIHKRAFDQGFRMKSYVDGDFMFPHFKVALEKGKGFSIPLTMPPGHAVSMGIDLASHRRRGNGIVVCATSPGGEKYPLDVRIVRASSPQLAQAVREMAFQWRPSVIIIENNAYQTSFIEWMQAAGEDFPFWDCIVPFFTGSNKADPEFGLQTLDIEFKNGSWAWPRELQPETNEHPPTCECGPCLLCAQISLHPQGDQIDALMAFWFAREGLRRYLWSAASSGYATEAIDPEEPGTYGVPFGEIVVP